MNKHFDGRFYQPLVALYNPFGFWDSARQRPCSYKDYEECYYQTLIMLFNTFPRGYIDIVLFLFLNTPMSMPDCVKFFNTFSNFGFKKEVELISLFLKSKERDMFLERLFRAFHTATESTLKKDMFLSALSRFDEYLPEYKKKIGMNQIYKL